MATIVVDTDNTLNIKQLISSLYMFKGVKRVCLEEDISYPKLDKSISDTKSGKTVRCKSVTELMQSLNA
ncbi:MAG: hypothetical protein LBS08_00225 [Candidatus Symbiothrix sp.]|jgi:hypothetical protein|nr:hypothetical protein [Candidatus Symbiothrix sp.]